MQIIVKYVNFKKNIKFGSLEFLILWNVKIRERAIDYFRKTPISSASSTMIMNTDFLRCESSEKIGLRIRFLYCSQNQIFGEIF